MSNNLAQLLLAGAIARRNRVIIARSPAESKRGRQMAGAKGAVVVDQLPDIVSIEDAKKREIREHNQLVERKRNEKRQLKLLRKQSADSTSS